MLIQKWQYKLYGRHLQIRVGRVSRNICLPNLKGIHPTQI
jgi:hypothetical protein